MDPHTKAEASTEISRIKALIRNIPDFPSAGILFRDLTPVWGDPSALGWLCATVAERHRSCAPDVVVAIESRGFVFGAPIATTLGAGFVPVRKPGKLPFESYQERYDLEYGQGSLEMHVDAVVPDQKVLIVDDLLATGGTAAAAARLVRRAGGRVVGFAFAVELSALAGRARLEDAVVTAEIVY